MKKIFILVIGLILISCQNTSVDEVSGVKAMYEDEKVLSETEVDLPRNPIKYHLENEKVKILVNQLGYQAHMRKVAIFRNIEMLGTFDVVSVDSDAVVYSGYPRPLGLDNNSGDYIVHGDFSEFKTPGKYYIRSEDHQSFVFEINEDVYDPVLFDATRMFYLQRCGGSVLDELHGFSHPSCHDHEAMIYDSQVKKDVTGGWHDAGDYGRYVVPASKAIADLLLAYQSTDKMAFDLKTEGQSDILDEITYKLDWLLKMQDKSGGVYHKVTGKNFSSTVAPEVDTNVMVLSPISDAATADFSAVMAMASYIYDDEKKSKKYRQAAIKAYDYIRFKGDLQAFNNPSDISTGEYGDTHLEDELFWACVELYKATGNEMYHDQLKKHFDPKYLGLGWTDMGAYGVYSYLTLDSDKVDSKFYQDLESGFLHKADNLVKMSADNPYFISLSDHYPWGSNMSVANTAMYLYLAHDIKANDTFTICAENHLNYLFGVNPMAMSYVTGYGSLTPDNPHHRPSQFLRKTMPGMLVGGPNSDLQDPFAAEILKDAPPAKCYLDVEQSYSCNEVTIYWNSSLVYILARR